MEYGNKINFQDRCRLLLRNGRYPTEGALGYSYQHTLDPKHEVWRAEVLNEWLDANPGKPLPSRTPPIIARTMEEGRGGQFVAQTQ